VTHKNICYHTRLDSRNSVKVVGGTFAGSFDWPTVERLVKSQFTVKIKASGRAVFVDKGGREISLYVSVDPELTEAGKLATTEDRQAREAMEKADSEKAARVDALLANLSHDEIIKRLSQ